MTDNVQIIMEVSKEEAKDLQSRYQTFLSGVGHFVPFPKWLAAHLLK